MLNNHALESKISGWIPLDKPLGMTSNAALQKIRKIFNFCKGGYVGTLDPLATGFLPIALGSATKTIHLLDNQEKEYIFVVKWGGKTTTGDIEGIVEKKSKKIPKVTEIKKKVKNFIGEITQTPPRYSSVKINGKRAYKLARKNLIFKLKKRKVRILDFLLIKVISSEKMEFYVKCSSGTYIRTLVEDFAVSLGTYGTVFSLRRIGFGSCNKKLISLDYLLSLMHSEQQKNVIKPIDYFFSAAREFSLKKEEVSMILNGHAIKIENERMLSYESNPNRLVFAKYANQAIALGYFLESFFYPKRLLGN